MTYAHTHLQKVRAEQRAEWLHGHILLGYHPETKVPFTVRNLDRQSGTLIEGVPGVGKSSMLVNLILQDAAAGQTVIVIDPHGDLTKDCIARLPEEALSRTYVLDMADEDYPFGVNALPQAQAATAVAQARAVDLTMHAFEAVWPDVLSQLHLPRYLRAAIVALLQTPGSTLFDLYRFLLDDAFRQAVLKNVTDSTITDFWRTQYDELPMAQRNQRVGPLLNRSESLFLARSLVRNILGQAESKLDFRKAIEDKGRLIFIRLLMKTLEQDAKLIGTFIVAQAHAALFSFADLPEEERPGFSLYIDEASHFVTKDIDELLSEGRKFCIALTLCHQHRHQLPDFLQASTMMAYTKICFRQIPEDARKMAPAYPEQEILRPEDLETDIIGYLLRRGSDNPIAQCFTDVYLRPLHTQPRKNGRIEIITPGVNIDHIGDNILRGFLQLPKNTDHPTVTDPMPFLNHLLYDCMKHGSGEADIPLIVAYGFSNCGNGFYPSLHHALDKQTLLSNRVQFPPYLVVEGAGGKQRWTRLPEGHKEQCYHFLFHLRATMRWLAENPIGRKTRQTTFDIAQMLTQLPRRAAFVRSGDDVGVIYTDNTPAPVEPDELSQRLRTIQAQTRATYCTPRSQLEAALQPTIDADEALKLSRWQEVE